MAPRALKSTRREKREAEALAPKKKTLTIFSLSQQVMH